MPAIHQGVLKRYAYTGTVWEWQTLYPVTLANLVGEVTDRNFMTDAQKEWVDDISAIASIDGLNDLVISENINLPINKYIRSNGVERGSGTVQKHFRFGADYSEVRAYDYTGAQAREAYIRAIANSGDAYLLVSGVRLTGLGAPVNNTDAVRKQDLDNYVAQALKPKASVLYADSSITTVPTGTGTTVDGKSVVVGNRVLLHGLTSTTLRGVYLVAAGAWTKVTADSEKGSLVFVSEGNTNAQKFYNNAGDVTVWVEFANVIEYGVASAGGLEKTGVEFGIKSGGVTNTMLAGSIEYSKINNYNLTALSWTAFSNNTSLDMWLGQIIKVIATMRGNIPGESSEWDAFKADVGARVKNSTFVGTSAPSYPVSGDLWLDTTGY